MTKNILKYAIILALSLSFGLTACSRKDHFEELQVPPHHQNTEKPEGAIRLMTYNVATFTRDPNDINNYQTIADMINEKDADLVCLNELDSCTTRTGNVYQLEKFAKIIGDWDFKYAGAIPYKGGTYGEGIATKKKAIKKFHAPMPKLLGAEDRVLVVMELEDYVIATTHLAHDAADDHAAQLQVIKETLVDVYKDSDKPVFLGGDMNAIPTSQTIQTLEKDWVVMSPKQPTFPANKPIKCLDYIMMLKNDRFKYEVLTSEVLRFFKSGNASTASDHLPVLVDVKILPNN